MLWYSCSAPRIDLSELEDEASRLPEDERRRVQHDLRGTIPIDEDREDLLVQQKLSEFHQYLDTHGPATEDSFFNSAGAPLVASVGRDTLRERFHSYVYSRDFNLMVLSSRRYNFEV